MINRAKKLEALPKTDDEYWDGAETMRHSPVKVIICATHDRHNWINHRGYVQDDAGKIRCEWCPWGTRLPWFYRLHEGKIVDLRSDVSHLG